MTYICDILFRHCTCPDHCTIHSERPSYVVPAAEYTLWIDCFVKLESFSRKSDLGLIRARLEVVFEGLLCGYYRILITVA